MKHFRCISEHPGWLVSSTRLCVGVKRCFSRTVWLWVEVLAEPSVKLQNRTSHDMKVLPSKFSDMLAGDELLLTTHLQEQRLTGCRKTFHHDEEQCCLYAGRRAWQHASSLPETVQGRRDGI